MQFLKTDSNQTGFQLYGMNLETDEAGVVFHNLGINGAATTSFLRCSLLSQQLATIKPDLVILGLGINDAYGKNFSQIAYENNYDQLVKEIRKANPDVSIIYTTNNDSYIRRRYLNRNGIKVQESMKRLAKNQNTALWDMFEVMGGLNSIVVWQRYGLAKKDRIHFTRAGYILMGDLIFDSIIQDFGKYLARQNNEQTTAALLNQNNEQR
jgi:lysophospholipase L1-like esterase